MQTAHRPILIQKIASAEVRKAHTNVSAAALGEAVATALGDYFVVKIKSPAVRSRIANRERLESSSGRRAWYLFDAGEAKIFAAFDFTLVIAATNAAIGKLYSEKDDKGPTSVDRTVAGALAFRAASALVAARQGAARELALLQSAWSFSDLKVDKGVSAFEVFEFDDLDLSSGVRVNMAIGIGSSISRPRDVCAAHDAGWGPLLSAIALGAEIGLEVKIGEARATYADLMSLAPGRVFAIDLLDRENIPLSVKGAPHTVLYGQLGGHEGKRALRVNAHSPGKILTRQQSGN